MRKYTPNCLFHNQAIDNFLRIASAANLNHFCPTEEDWKALQDLLAVLEVHPCSWNTVQIISHEYFIQPPALLLQEMSQQRIPMLCRVIPRFERCIGSWERLAVDSPNLIIRDMCSAGLTLVLKNQRQTMCNDTWTMCSRMFSHPTLIRYSHLSLVVVNPLLRARWHESDQKDHVATIQNKVLFVLQILPSPHH